MMAQMKASGARIETLVKKMNAATGDAKTEAIAELLTALVEDRRLHESMMANMSGMMSMMHGGGAGQGQGHTRRRPNRFSAVAGASRPSGPWRHARPRAAAPRHETRSDDGDRLDASGHGSS